MAVLHHYEAIAFCDCFSKLAVQMMENDELDFPDNIFPSGRHRLHEAYGIMMRGQDSKLKFEKWERRM